jgi:hypothetical protein
MNPGGERLLKLAADQRGQVGAATLPTRGRSIGFRRGTEPNEQGRPAYACVFI